MAAAAAAGASIPPRPPWEAAYRDRDTGQTSAAEVWGGERVVGEAEEEDA